MGQLRRDLGFWEMAAVCASMIFGTGIFFGPSVTAQEFPNTAQILLLWAAGAGVALCGAFAFGRLAALHPLSGGPYVYVREAYGRLPGFLFAWTSFAVIAPSSLAVMANVFATNLAKLEPMSPAAVLVLAFWSLVAAAFANTLGVGLGGRAQDLLTGLKLALVGAIIVLLLGHGPGAPATQGPGGGHWSLALVGILFSVGGWDYAVLASEEVKEPRRTIPRAMMAGTGAVMLVYLLVVGGFLRALGPVGMAAAGGSLAPNAMAAVVPGSAPFVAVVVAISAFATINAVMLLGPRATFAAARDGLAPAWAAQVSPRWGTPVVAIVVQVALATLYYVSGQASNVAAYTVMGTGLFIVLSCLALPALRRRAGGPRWAVEDAAAGVVVLAYVAFLVFWLAEETLAALVGLGIVASGLLFYAFVAVPRGRARQA